MIFLVALNRPAGGCFDLLQLVDVRPRNLGGGKGLGCSFGIGGIGLVHRLLHIPCSRGQFLY